MLKTLINNLPTGKVWQKKHEVGSVLYKLLQALASGVCDVINDSVQSLYNFVTISGITEKQIESYERLLSLPNKVFINENLNDRLRAIVATRFYMRDNTVIGLQNLFAVLGIQAVASYDSIASNNVLSVIIDGNATSIGSTDLQFQLNFQYNLSGGDETSIDAIVALTDRVLNQVLPSHVTYNIEVQ